MKLKISHLNPIRLHTYLLLHIILITTGLSFRVNGQSDTLTLDSCYTLARLNYPMLRQRALIDQSASYNVENASKGNLPQVSIYGQATYQSDVPHLPIELPGAQPPLIPKDQYKVYGEINQVIYDGGSTKLQKNADLSSAQVQQQGLEVELYTLKERINQLYFGILLINEQLEQTQFYIKDIEIGLTKTNAAITNGIALRSSADVLKVELLKTRQRIIELTSMQKAYMDMLSLMINRPVDDLTVLIVPPSTIPSSENRRPELTWFELQRQNLSLQYDLLNVQNRPKVNLFLQGGIGRPGLNIFDDQLTGFYYGGVRLFWPLSGFYQTNNDKSLIELHRQEIGLKQETFLFNNRLQVKQGQQELSKLEALLETDDEIVALRESIKQTALHQLENGVITSNDYLKEINAEDNARQSKIVHEIQLLMAQYNLRTTLGQ